MATKTPPALAVVVMGVCGTGKSTIGQQLATRLGLIFADADDFHPPANVTKMRDGTPLNDADREPWLHALRKYLATTLADGNGCVLACSALKHHYRQLLSPSEHEVRFVFLHGSRELLAQRMGSRPDHFMPTTLLDSQLATLEPPSNQEAIWCDVSSPPATIVDQLAATLSRV